MCKIDSQWESCETQWDPSGIPSGNPVWCSELKPTALWQPRGVGWGGVGGGSRRKGHIYIPMVIHVDVWQKPTQYCKAIILQLKISNFLKIPFHIRQIYEKREEKITKSLRRGAFGVMAMLFLDLKTSNWVCSVQENSSHCTLLIFAPLCLSLCVCVCVCVCVCM